MQYEYTKQKNKVDTTRIKGLYFLNIAGSESLFFSQAQYVADSIIASDRRLGKKTDFKKLPNDLLESFVKKNRDLKTTTFYSNGLIENDFQYTESFNFNWKIATTRKKVLGYNATLAKTFYAGREYHAYFTEEIPISEGPYKFYGLPGLILEICDSEVLHCFKLSGMQMGSTGKLVDLSGRKFIMTTREKFIAVKKQNGENPMQRMYELMSSTGITETTDKNGNIVDIRKLVEKTQKSLQERYKKFNEIEL